MEQELAKRKKERTRKEQIQKEPHQLDFESKGEQEYYYSEIYSKLQSGIIVVCDLHKTFLLLPATEYCGLKLPKAAYTPDFYIEYANGTVEVVEIKNKVIRKLQRDYIYRRRLFIEKWARPNGWIFREVITGV